MGSSIKIDNTYVVAKPRGLIWRPGWFLVQSLHSAQDAMIQLYFTRNNEGLLLVRPMKPLACNEFQSLFRFEANALSYDPQRTVLVPSM